MNPEDKTYVVALTYLVRATDPNAAVQAVARYHTNEEFSAQQDALVKTRGDWNVSEVNIMVVETDTQRTRIFTPA